MNDLYERILAIYPELNNEDFMPTTGCISLVNYSDGNGSVIEKWEHPFLAQPTKKQLEAVVIKE